MPRAALYINSKGYDVTRHSYSGGDLFQKCARKYYYERVQGWAEKGLRSSMPFGIAMESAITFYHQNRLQGGVEEFVRLWAEHKDKPYSYTKSDLDWDRLNQSGQELVKLYAIRYPDFPYIVSNPMQSFQVNRFVEPFPGTELTGITFTAYIDLLAQIKGSFEPIIIDMKTSGKDVPELTVLDPQLRSYAWVTGYPNVGFLWLRKCGRSISKGDTVTLLEPYGGFSSGDDVIVLASDDFGLFVTQNKRTVDEIDGLFKGKSKATEVARASYIHENATHVSENTVTKQKVQFKHAVITTESSEDISVSIKQDIIAIHAASTNNHFPMRSGVRWPNDQCTMCAMRGICIGDNELRDKLIERKQVDELALDFSQDDE